MELDALLAAPGDRTGAQLVVYLCAGGRLTTGDVARALRAATDPIAHRFLGMAVVTEACRRGDGTPIELLEGMPHAVRGALENGPAAQERIDDAAVLAFARILGPASTLHERTAFAARLETMGYDGHDIAVAAPWLLAQLDEPHWDAGWAAVRTILAVLRQANDAYRQHDAASKTRRPPDRAALEAAARTALLPALVALTATAGPARANARCILVALAVNDGRWEDLDAQIAGTPEHELRSVARGLVSAIHGRASRYRVGLETDPSAAARVAGIVARAARIRARLGEDDRDVLDDAIRDATRELGLANEAKAPAAELVARLVGHTSPAVARLLGEELTRDPSQGKLLPALGDAPADARHALVALHWQLVAKGDDPAAIRDLLAEIDRLGLSPRPIADTFQYRRRITEPLLPLLAPLIDHPEGNVRSAIVGGLQAAVAHDRLELADWAGPILRSTIDRDGDDHPARAGLALARAALGTTAHHDAFLAAAREIARDLDPARHRDLAPQLRKLFPDEHESLLSPRTARRPPDEAALLAAIARAPDDDAPRLVYADALLEVGDMHGELIVLQCTRRGGPPTPRERALLRLNTRVWLGKLAAVTAPDSVVFERGFLVACMLDPPLEQRIVPLLARAPHLTTVRVPDDRVDELIEAPRSRLPSLQTIMSRQRTFVRRGERWISG